MINIEEKTPTEANVKAFLKEQDFVLKSITEHKLEFQNDEYNVMYDREDYTFQVITFLPLSVAAKFKHEVFFTYRLYEQFINLLIIQNG
ncbi:MAG: hypothetical protein EOP48_25600 [Sphingobacteriales bacterium]|nr:MAG: hypothetical protein EOP48_25600 [Sphingobacteriales bacterium]